MPSGHRVTHLAWRNGTALLPDGTLTVAMTDYAFSTSASRVERPQPGMPRGGRGGGTERGWAEGPNGWDAWDDHAQTRLMGLP